MSSLHEVTPPSPIHPPPPLREESHLHIIYHHRSTWHMSLQGESTYITPAQVSPHGGDATSHHVTEQTVLGPAIQFKYNRHSSSPSFVLLPSAAPDHPTHPSIHPHLSLFRGGFDSCCTASWSRGHQFFFFFFLLRNIYDVHIHSRPASSEVLHKIRFLLSERQLRGFPIHTPAAYSFALNSLFFLNVAAIHIVDVLNNICTYILISSGGKLTVARSASKVSDLALSSRVLAGNASSGFKVLCHKKISFITVLLVSSPRFVTSVEGKRRRRLSDEPHLIDYDTNWSMQQNKHEHDRE